MEKHSPPRCLFLVGGRRCGKSTLGEKLGKITSYVQIGGKNGADNVRDRISLYSEFEKRENIILESHQVNNSPVVEMLLKMGYRIDMVFLNTKLETRKRNQYLKNGKKTMSQSQIDTHKSALSFFTRTEQSRQLSKHVIFNDGTLEESLRQILESCLLYPMKTT